MLGLAIPNRPPLGTALGEKIEAIVSGLILQLYYAMTGISTDVWHMHWGCSSSCSSPGSGSSSASWCRRPYYLEIPLHDAVSLSLFMNSKGIVEVITFNFFLTNKLIGKNTFSILICLSVAITAVLVPVAITFRILVVVALLSQGPPPPALVTASAPRPAWGSSTASARRRVASGSRQRPPPRRRQGPSPVAASQPPDSAVGEGRRPRAYDEEEEPAVAAVSHRASPRATTEEEHTAHRVSPLTRSASASVAGHRRPRAPSAAHNWLRPRAPPVLTSPPPCSFAASASTPMS
ncbi:uncharacterized protein LOC127757994 [Oryza glaberrima]|uniref:uncharacterized protein LOC127757994 n=1 Tax=Oryza glaberrima TaxID=4538 RepID=UPI00224C4A8D|nr:uncharacterized protein LOC127757994 [Oryza glaberrima]